VPGHYLQQYIDSVVAKENGPITPDTPLFWSTWARPRQSKPMSGKNLWRLCKTYGLMIGYPQLKPHDLRHGVAMEMYGQHRDLEQVRALLGHARIQTHPGLRANPAEGTQDRSEFLRSTSLGGAQLGAMPFI
jgi:site-specific recombinase XerD